MPKKLSVEKMAIIAAAGALAYVLAVPAGPTALQDFDKFERIAQALEAYAIDNGGAYPVAGILPNSLTTPVAYLAPSAMVDPVAGTAAGLYRFRYSRIKGVYNASVQAMYGDWVVYSPGYSTTGATFNPVNYPVVYDATNGTISYGIMMRSQRSPVETGAGSPS